MAESETKNILGKIKPKAVGGQAVIEGVMMKGAEDIAIAVRKPNGEIVVKKEKLQGNRKKISKIPILRGVYAFADSLVLGVKSLMFSAEFIEEELPKDGKEPKKAGRIEEFMEKNVVAVSVTISMVFTIVLFILLPTWLVDLFNGVVTSSIAKNIIEGIFRIMIFLLYIAAISRMKDIQRVFEYHGAEHKTIFAYEFGEELTVENVKKHSSLHPRCGTSFLFIVMIVSILVFSAFSWSNIFMRTLVRLAFLPVVAGISYEIIKWAGRSHSAVSRWVSAPGMWLQKITTREPDDGQIEVAIMALKSVITDDSEADNW